MTHLRFMRGLKLNLNSAGLHSRRKSSHVPKLSEDFKFIRLKNAHLRIEGVEARPFLQGLITNDMECLTRDCNALYSMVLNVKGRVLTDLLIYNEDPNNCTDTFILQFDSSQRENIYKLFKKYKLRRKITIKDVTDDIESYASLGCYDERPVNIPKSSRLYRDPRLKQLGWRLLSDRALSPTGLSGDETLYREWRYRLGVGEGVEENIPEKALPLECNLDLLNGVSFSKGCYIGQELTARTHHTGVIRKRLMPITLHDESEEHSLRGCTLNNSEGKSVGTVKANLGMHGLALVRLSHITKSGSSFIDYNKELIPCSVSVPSWWPSSILESAV